jgi:transposase-like protein
MASGDRTDKSVPAPAPSASAPADDIQRWTAGRKAAVVLDLIKGRTTVADVARQFDLTVAEVDSWVERFMDGGREGLRAVPRDLEARFDAEKKDLLAKVGELTLQVDALKKKTSSAGTLLDRSGTAQSL